MLVIPLTVLTLLGHGTACSPDESQTDDDTTSQFQTTTPTNDGTPTPVAPTPPEEDATTPPWTPPAGDDDTPGDDDASDDDDTTPPNPTPTPVEAPTPTAPTDQDGDGYPVWYLALDTPEIADCDDQDPAVNPTVERLVPEGWFWRGNDEFEDTAPMRQIWLSAYCLDVVPVTNAQFAAFMNARVPEGLGEQTADGLPLFDFDDQDDDIPERIVRDGHGGYAVLDGYEDHPVTEVYQWSGETYCAAHGKRLPSEAEWEKGARGDQDMRDYPWGDDAPTCDLANFSDLVLDDDGRIVSNDPCVGDTVPVGSYPNASPFGLLDMTGNVAEFTSDFYRADYYASSPDVDPEGPDSGWAEDPMNPDGFEAIVARGGVWAAMAMPVWGRWSEPLDANSNGVGFRCARSLAPPPGADETTRRHPAAWSVYRPPLTAEDVSYRPPMSYTRAFSAERSTR